jgi:hypothetical protein
MKMIISLILLISFISCGKKMNSLDHSSTDSTKKTDLIERIDQHYRDIPYPFIQKAEISSFDLHLSSNHNYSARFQKKIDPLQFAPIDLSWHKENQESFRRRYPIKISDTEWVQLNNSLKEKLANQNIQNLFMRLDIKVKAKLYHRHHLIDGHVALYLNQRPLVTGKIEPHFNQVSLHFNQDINLDQLIPSIKENGFNLYLDLVDANYFEDNKLVNFNQNQTRYQPIMIGLTDQMLISFKSKDQPLFTKLSELDHRFLSRVDQIYYLFDQYSELSQQYDGQKWRQLNYDDQVTRLYYGAKINKNPQSIEIKLKQNNNLIKLNHTTKVKLRLSPPKLTFNQLNLKQASHRQRSPFDRHKYESCRVDYAELSNQKTLSYPLNDFHLLSQLNLVSNSQIKSLDQLVELDLIEIYYDSTQVIAWEFELTLPAGDYTFEWNNKLINEKIHTGFQKTTCRNEHNYRHHLYPIIEYDKLIEQKINLAIDFLVLDRQ